MSELTLMAVGDISLCSRVNHNPFSEILPVLKRNDILFGNLECVLTDSGEDVEKAVSITASLNKVKYLKEAGFDIVNVANNHIMDRGWEGLRGTLDILSQENIKYIGIGENKSGNEAVIFRRKGISAGFLGYDKFGYYNNRSRYFVHKIDTRSIINSIKLLKSECDVVIVSLHWGMEYSQYPSPRQIRFAHTMIDAGASIIIGHHPHVMQGVEEYNGGVIAYSLGNFQFDTEIGGKLNTGANRSLILSLKISKSGRIGHDIIPIVINKEYIPIIPDSSYSRALRHYVSEISTVITSNKITWNRWFRTISRNYLQDSLASWHIRIKKYGLLHLMMYFKWLMSPFTLCCFIFTVISHFYKDKIFTQHDMKHELLQVDQSCPDKTNTSNIKRIRIIKSNKSHNYGAKDRKKIQSAREEGLLNVRDYR